MQHVYALQRQQRKRGPMTAVSFAEPTRSFAPVTFPPSPTMLPHENQGHFAHVAQFRHAFDSISIYPPAPGRGAGRKATLEEPLQRKEAGTPPVSGDTVYTVAPGDTLRQIAAAHNTTWQTLAEHNNKVADPNLIYPGEQISIPSNGTNPPAPQPTDAPQPLNTTPAPTATNPTDAPQPLVTTQPAEAPQPLPATPKSTDAPQPVPAPAPPAPAPAAPTPAPSAPPPAPAARAPQHDTANHYPNGQCTWWANQHFADLHNGNFVPWMGDAHSWSDLARGYAGWKVSDQPTVGAITVFQKGVQFADPTYGHVAIVKQILPDGSIITSNMNVINHPFGSVVDLTNRPGPGVSFITAG